MRVMTCPKCPYMMRKGGVCTKCGHTDEPTQAAEVNEDLPSFKELREMPMISQPAKDESAREVPDHVLGANNFVWQRRVRSLEAENKELREKLEKASDLWKQHQATKFKTDGSHFQVDVELNKLFALESAGVK